MQAQHHASTHRGTKQAYLTCLYVSNIPTECYHHTTPATGPVQPPNKL